MATRRPMAEGRWCLLLFGQVLSVPNCQFAEGFVHSRGMRSALPQVTYSTDYVLYRAKSKGSVRQRGG
jgi:hypothetical protein